jgi:hypothetical protein
METHTKIIDEDVVDDIEHIYSEHIGTIEELLDAEVEKVSWICDQKI